MRLEQRYQQQQRGFSLIELSLVMLLSSVIVAAIYQTFHTQQKTYQQQNVLALMQQNVRASTFIITRELRSARYDPRQSGNFGFVTRFNAPHDTFTVNYAVDTEIIAFTVDADRDGTVDATPAELIAYRFNRTARSLERYNAGNGWQALAEDIDGVHFAYYDNAGVATTNPGLMSYVEVSLVIRSGTQEVGYTNTHAYTNKGGQNICPYCAAEPHHRRQLWSTTVQIRNPV